jgi:anthranilate phosphoribosyltransferase
MKPIDRLLIDKDLSEREARQLFVRLFERDHDPLDKKMKLALLQKKGEHANELAGLVRTIRRLEKPIKVGRVPFLVDGCGTGGDGKHAFNISTIACLVAAGAGARVAKHGNRSITSQCGSSDVLEGLGVNILASKPRMIKALRQTGFGYFHAPLYHPSFRSIQPVRKELARKKVRTIFNLTGPLVNPFRPKSQVIGVFNQDALMLVARASAKLGFKRALVVWNTAGYDELTTSARSIVVEITSGKAKRYTLSPKSLGFRHGNAKNLTGGNQQVNTRIARNILTGKDRSIKRDVVLLNAGAIVLVSGRARSLREGILLARRSIDSKSAFNVLEKLKRISNDS